MKKMKTIDKKSYIIFIFLLILVCILKKSFISSINEDGFALFVKQLFICKGADELFNILWILPIFINLFFGTKDSCLYIENYNTRFRNRNKYIKYVLQHFYIKSFVLSFVTILIHFIFFISNSSELYNLEVCYVILYFIIFIFFFNDLVLLVYIYIKKYIYSYLIVSMVVFLFIYVFKLSYIKYTLLTFILVQIILNCIIKRKYNKCDIGGEII